MSRPRRPLHAVAGAACCLALTACGPSAGRETKLVAPTYLLGTLGKRTVDLRDVCDGGIPAGEVSVHPTAGTVAFGVLTLGMYLPLELRVQCSAPRAPVRLGAR